MTTTTSLTVLALFAVGLMASPASAHPTLKSATPPADGAASAPRELRLNFSEGVISKFSSVDLKDQNGKKISTEKVVTDPNDKKQLVVPLKEPLKAGSYAVKWNVVSEDTHRVNGTYTFKVDP